MHQVTSGISRRQWLAWVVTGWCLSLMCASACVQSTSVACSDGRVCPPSYVCNDAHGGCASAAQVADCQGKDELAACSYPGVSEGACFDRVCLPGGCGNGVITEAEVCDDSNHVNGDGCSSDCLSNETCGNGIIDMIENETCDDGNTVDGDGCQATCVSPRCGDGVIDEEYNERCDDGVANSEASNAACRTNCQQRRCGDGVMDTAEICDDGNLAPADGCTPDCLSNETCGNGYTDFLVGEQCDPNDVDALSHDGCSACRFELPTWKLADPGSPRARTEHALVYDAARGRVVLFGGIGGSGAYLADTWEWDGSGWTNVTPPSGNPSARKGHALAYDAARRRVVLFGGYNAGAFNDTWEWNGSSWTNVTPASGRPPVREGHALAYDAARGRVVLFGGKQLSLQYSDTWEWNGTTWTNMTPASGNPPGRYAHAVAYDAARARVVVFGGYNASNGLLADTWEWNGVAWTNATPSSASPPARWLHALAYDAVKQRVVLYGGHYYAASVDQYFDDTWEWNGSAWTDVTPSSGNPPARKRHKLAYDTARGRAVLFGGTLYNGTTTLDETWEWNGSAWTDATPAADAPSDRYGHAQAYDAARGRVVLFGGTDASPYLADTWEWNGSSWKDVTPVSGSPSARTSHALAYDADRKRVVLFGGNSGTGALADTWEWDGSTWSDVTPASGNPPARSGDALAYDAARKRVVLFGGNGGSGGLADTWEWNGSTWINVTPASGSPSARHSHALAYDGARGKVVLFGGYDSSSGNFADTWAWNGTAWTNVTPASENPSARRAHTLAYDERRGRVLLFGGHSGGDVADTWEWNGTAWTNVTPASSNPPTREGNALAYDAASGHTVLFGGVDTAYVRLGDTWTFRDETRGAAEGCLYGFDGDSDGKIACADVDCFGYCTPLCNPTIMSCDLTLPHCGDGECQPVETKRLCPADCGAPTVVCGDFMCETPETTQSCPGDCP